MTSPAVETIDVQVPEPLPQQEVILAHPARFKLWRAGRRSGKSRAELHAALFGHGPNRCWKGLVHGKDVGWVAPDFPQAKTIWEEEIEPRFKDVEGWTLSEQDRSVTLDGAGTLFLVSFENIRAVRGRGKRLGGLVIDEGAHFNLRYAWRSVLRPALMDCGGWAFFGSTTNAGPDGALDEVGHRQSPSFFNTLCEQVMAGLRGPSWAHWHSDARANPTIDPAEFQALVEEYDADSQMALEEEVYANLLHGGAGLAFPEWAIEVHQRTLEPDDEMPCAAGMDWGHGTPGWFGIVHTLPDQRLYLRRELYFRRIRAKKVGYLIGKLCLLSPVVPDYIALDSSCFNDDGTVTIAEKIQQGLEIAYARHNQQHGTAYLSPELWKGPKGPQALRNQTELIREVLAYERDADGVLVEPPTLTVHPDCRDFMRTVAKLPLDPRNPNQFDSKSEDHPVQGLAYLLGTRTPGYVPPEQSKELLAQRAKLDTASRREAESGDAVMEKAAKAWNRGNR